MIFLAWWATESELVSGFGAEYYENYTDSFAYLDSVDMQFAWDGVPLVEERTPNKRFQLGDEDVFLVAAGTFMPPRSLSVGKHRLTTTVVEGMPLFGNGREAKWSVNVNILPC